MRKIIFIVSFVFSTMTFGQSPDASTLYPKEYYDIMNYVPKNFVANTTYQPESKLLQTELNTIGSLQMLYGLKQDFKLSTNDILWLRKSIDHMARLLFLDGKRILFSAAGGYSGCPDKMLDTITLNDTEIVNLKLCHSCTDAHRDTDFIRVFNHRMYSLMEIDPPNGKTP